MGKKRRRIKSSKFVEKNSIWREAVLKTKELAGRIDEVAEAVSVPSTVEKPEAVSKPTKPAKSATKKTKAATKKTKATTRRRKTSKATKAK